jgi:hypothetical protein
VPFFVLVLSIAVLVIVIGLKNRLPPRFQNTDKHFPEQPDRLSPLLGPFFVLALSIAVLVIAPKNRLPPRFRNTNKCVRDVFDFKPIDVLAIMGEWKFWHCEFEFEFEHEKEKEKECEQCDWMAEQLF